MLDVGIAIIGVAAAIGAYHYGKSKAPVTTVEVPVEVIKEVQVPITLPDQSKTPIIAMNSGSVAKCSVCTLDVARHVTHADGSVICANCNPVPWID